MCASSRSPLVRHKVIARSATAGTVAGMATTNDTNPHTPRQPSTLGKGSLDPRVELLAAGRGIDLSPAVKLIGSHVERRRWLGEMLDVDGMSPGLSSRAHARAFRFATALGRAGYTVVEGPFGPRGGRRFRLECYGGLPAALLYKVMEHRDCVLQHR